MTGFAWDDPEYQRVMAQADGDMPEQADHHDGPCTVKDCQRCRAERAEARIAELEAEIARWEDRTNP